MAGLWDFEGWPWMKPGSVGIWRVQALWGRCDAAFGAPKEANFDSRGFHHPRFGSRPPFPRLCSPVVANRLSRRVQGGNCCTGCTCFRSCWLARIYIVGSLYRLFDWPHRYCHGTELGMRLQGSMPCPMSIPSEHDAQRPTEADRRREGTPGRSRKFVDVLQAVQSPHDEQATQLPETKAESRRSYLVCWLRRRSTVGRGVPGNGRVVSV